MQGGGGGRQRRRAGVVFRLRRRKPQVWNSCEFGPGWPLYTLVRCRGPRWGLRSIYSFFEVMTLLRVSEARVRRVHTAQAPLTATENLT